MHIYTYTYTHIHTHTYTHTLHTCTHTYIHTYTHNRGTWCKWNYEYNNVKTSTNIVKMSDVKKICL